MTAGYSGTPLARKLGVKDGARTWRLNMPDSIAAEILDYGVKPKILGRPGPELDHAHIFVTERREMAKNLKRLRALLAPAGMIWVSWPKKSAKKATDITEHEVRAEALPLGLVDVKVCAIDETWSGLKLVIRKSAR